VSGAKPIKAITPTMAVATDTMTVLMTIRRKIGCSGLTPV